MSSIQYSPFTSIFENGAAGTVIIGSPGSGKTFSINNIIANCLELGIRVCGLDPKNDMGLLSQHYNIKNIDINNISEGVLNPFKFLEPINLTTLVSIVQMIVGEFDQNQTVAVTPILNDFVNLSRGRKNLTFLDMAEYLYSSQDLTVQKVGTILMSNEESEYGKLIFGNSNDTLFNKLDNFIFSYKGMSLPSYGAEPQPDQKFNTAIVYMIVNKIRELLKKDNSVPTLLVVDEAHIAFKTPSFKEVINDMLILGRSLNVATLMASQGISHFPPEMSQLLSNAFAFKSKPIESKKFIELFYSASSDEEADIDDIVSKISTLDIGEAFMIDRKSRMAFFKFKSNFGEDMSSNPLAKKGRKNYG